MVAAGSVGADSHTPFGRDSRGVRQHSVSGLRSQPPSSMQRGGDTLGDDAFSVSSGGPMLSSQLLRAVKQHGRGVSKEVGSVKCYFGVAMAVGLFGGLLSMLVGYGLGELLTDISNRLYLATDQALAFQTAEQLFRAVGAVQAGITADPGPVIQRQRFDDFVATAYRHEARHSTLLQTRTYLTSDQAAQQANERKWLQVEPSASGGTPRQFNVSL